MQNKKIVITGGPGTGKSSVIKYLERQGHQCLHEVSRQITVEAQKQGISQLFLEQPLLFSEKLKDARVEQYLEASTKLEKFVFLDRGLPDIVAYMDYFDTSYPTRFKEACENHKYQQVFLLPPWEEIYRNDNERYENFEQATRIHQFLEKAYISFGYEAVSVPKLSVELRCKFILNNLLV